ncbi:hypothetical protein I6F26_02265 [Ensifer sp. IC3342]|nr:hypothetical protein [Ensifer sp. BRP08]MCA1445415.1 hypothetical protein [Ensifer sp. IC3342]
MARCPGSALYFNSGDELMLIALTATLFALIGLVIGAGGIRLLMLGGSPYYLIAGLGFLLTAFLLFRRRHCLHLP